MQGEKNTPEAPRRCETPPHVPLDAEHVQAFAERLASEFRLMPTLDGRTLTLPELRWGFGRLASAMDWLVGGAVTREILTRNEWWDVDKLAAVAKIHGDFLHDLLAKQDEGSASSVEVAAQAPAVEVSP